MDISFFFKQGIIFKVNSKLNTNPVQRRQENVSVRCQVAALWKSWVEQVSVSHCSAHFNCNYTAPFDEKCNLKPLYRTASSSQYGLRQS